MPSPPAAAKVLGLRAKFPPVRNGNDSEGPWGLNGRKKLGRGRCRAGHCVGPINMAAHGCSLASALVSGEDGEPGLASLTGHSPGPWPEQAPRLPTRRTGGQPEQQEGQPLSQSHYRATPGHTALLQAALATGASWGTLGHTTPPGSLGLL